MAYQGEAVAAAGLRSPQEQDDARASRVSAYCVLAGLLRAAPDAGRLAQLAALPLTEDQGREAPLGTAWRGLRNAAAQADAAAVNDEYHALFIGFGRGELLPYASWYLAGALMDRPLLALRLDLKRLGIARAAGNREPEDHVAALCETMALLIGSGDEGLPLATQRDFFTAHLAPWLGRFFGDLQASERAHFYRSVAAFGTAFSEFERAWLSMPG